MTLMKVLVLALLLGIASTRSARASLVDYEHKTIKLLIEIAYYSPGLLRENLDSRSMI